MAIEEVKRDNGETVYKYKCPANDVIYERLSEICETLKLYVGKQVDLNLSDLKLDDVLLGEALIRVDKRRDYFIIYHDDTRINEIKETALLIYWLIKFKPIKVINDQKTSKYRHINEAFAVFALYSVIKEEADRTGATFYISPEYTEKIMYAFKYWDLSKCALMLIAESLCASMHMEGKAKDV